MSSVFCIYGKLYGIHTINWIVCDKTDIKKSLLTVFTNSLGDFLCSFYQAQNGDTCRILADLALSVVVQFEADFLSFTGYDITFEMCNSYSIFSWKFSVVVMSKQFIDHSWYDISPSM